MISLQCKSSTDSKAITHTSSATSTSIYTNPRSIISFETADTRTTKMYRS